MSCTTSLLKGVDFMWLELTQQCNLYCVHCYSNSGGQVENKSLPLEKWYEVIEEGSQLGCKKIQFIGGEPTLIKKLVDIIEKARQEGYEDIEVFTNATLLSDELVEQFRKKEVSIATSFYSFNPLVHDSVTRTNGSFTKTVNSIRWIVDKQIPLRVGIISMSLNDDHISETVDYLVSLGVSREKIRIDRVRGQGRGKIISSDSGFDTLCGHCWMGKLAISYDGSVFPCVFARDFILGNVTNERLQDIVKKDSCIKFREDAYRMFNSKKYENKNNQCQPYEPCFPLMGCPPNPCDPNMCQPGWECEPARV